AAGTCGSWMSAPARSRTWATRRLVGGASQGDRASGQNVLVRLAVYTDYPYHRVGDAVFAERAFALFLSRLATEMDRLLVVGRLSPESDRARYALGAGVELAPLPYYPSLREPWPALLGMARSFTAFWKALGRVDCV